MEDPGTELVQMPPDEQEYFSERKLREIVKLQYASQQMEAFEKLKSKHNGWQIKGKER